MNFPRWRASLRRIRSPPTSTKLSRTRCPCSMAGSTASACTSRSRSDLPKVMADGEAIKRAVANLVDNAAEAMQDSLVREIEISTALGRQPRCRRDHRRRHRARRHSRTERKTLPALLFHQEARHRTWAGHREPHRSKIIMDRFASKKTIRWARASSSSLPVVPEPAAATPVAQHA